ncbi:MAG TPA: ATP-binding protein [Anaeromyxobacter sp.]
MPWRTLTGFLAAIAAIVIAVAAYFIVAADRNRRADDVTERSEGVRSLQRLEDALARAESAQREYLLTREERSLESYRGAVADIHAELDVVKRRAAKRPGPIPIDALSALIEAKLAELRRGVDVRAAGGVAEAQRDLRSGDGRWLSETVEGVRAEMEAVEGAELSEHRRAWFERIALADAIFLGANVLLLALVVAAGLAARAEMQRREERAQERLRMLELQERILGIVSHDLRTPLAAIDTGAAVLSRSGLPPKQARIAALIHSSSRRMARIIRDLLDYTRTRAREGIPLSIRPADVGEVCARVVEEAALRDGAVTLDLHRDGDLSGEWDTDRLEQVFGNLVGNAVRHAPPGTPVRVRALGEADRVRVEVENDGPPVPPESLRSIFDPFRRAAGADPGAAHAGVGLGLFIVRSIVEAHGGTVDVRSAPARPVTFTVRLPRTPPSARDATPASVWRPTDPGAPPAPAAGEITRP